MNILMALSQKEVTGAEVYAVTLSQELLIRGHKVVIVSDTLHTPTDAPFISIPFNERSLGARIGHVKQLLRIIKEYDIQVVHAHSRASSWSCALACKIARIPLITTTHGRQPVHFSRKLIKGFGQYSICVCENIQKQITHDLGFAPERTLLLRNMVDPKTFIFNPPRERSRAEDDAGTIVLSLIGRLSGPKGDVAYEVLQALSPYEQLKIRIIGGKDIPERFAKFKACSNVEFLGYRSDIPELIQSSDVIIGAGRVGIEAILSGRPVIAIGEAIDEGLVTKDTLPAALSSNFGDINDVKATRFHFEHLYDQVQAAMALSRNSAQLKQLRALVSQEFNLEQIVDAIEKLYSQTYVEYRRYEVPVLMYHRVVQDSSEIGIHGTYISAQKFRAHLQYLKDQGYQSMTFKDLREGKYKERFNRGNKWVILTFDDGYEDNYRVAFPLLQEFGFKAVIFLVSDCTYNLWDAEVAPPQKAERKFNLMSTEQVKEMMAYGIEFGAHTLDHPRLNEIPLEDARREIIESKRHLEERYQYPFTTFAYPYGALNEEVKAIAKEAGFDFAVATDSGSITLDHDLYQIRRIGIFPGNSQHTFKRKASGYYNFIKVRREQRAASRAQH